MFSKIPAAPMPPPIHMVTIPYFPFLRFSSRRSVAVNFAPVQPSGWPSATAPPFALILLISSPPSLITESACAATALSVIKEGGLDINKINANGGAVALGHPLGCTGAKLTATLLRELKRRNGKYGIVTMCIGGGMGAAGIFENIQ